MMETDGKPLRRKLRLGHYIVLGLVGLACVIQWTAFHTDHQISNMATAALVVLALVSLAIVQVRYASSWTRGLLPLVIFGTALGVFMLCFRFVGFSGELIPRFTSRFATPPPLPDLSESKPRTNEFIQDQSELDFLEFLGPGRVAFLPVRKFGLEWQPDPPRVIWKQPIGAGWSGFAIAGNLAVTMEQREQSEWIACYRVDDGQLVWKHAQSAQHYHPLGGAGPRTTPTLRDGRVYSQGVTGKLTCLNLADGTLVWQQDLLKLLGTSQLEVEQGVTWGRSGSPLIVDSLVIVPLGKSSARAESLIAFDLSTGAEVWRGGNSQISYASPQFMELCGRRQVVMVNEATVSGHAIDTGTTLWEHPWIGQTNGGANCSQPFLFNKDCVLLGKGYGGGGALLQITQVEGVFKAHELWHHPAVLKTKFTNTVIAGQFGYALSDGSLECIELSGGMSTWKQGRRGRYGHGQILGVEDTLLVLSEAGELAIVALDRHEYRELARFSVLHGTTWNTLALRGRMLLIRNGQEAACVQLPAR